MIIENARPTTRRRCAHPNAEPVELITGEVVAAICVDCLVALPAAWLGCGHTFGTDITSLAQGPGTELLCNECGGIYSPS